MAEMRGRPLLQAVENNSEHFLAIGAGTMIDAFYDAHRKFPDVENVRLSKEAGLEGVVVFMAGMPRDSVEHLVVEHNTFHEGAPNTFLQAAAE
eukprot:7223336-Lingulodinium_polyedra.AAC.1